MARTNRITEAMTAAFQEGFTNPNAPLTPGEERLIRRAGPRFVYVDDLVESAEQVGPVDAGEIQHVPFVDDGNADIVDAEIIED